MKRLNKHVGLLFLFLILSTVAFGQIPSLRRKPSAIAKRHIDKLKREHFPGLQKRKGKIEANRSTIAPQECNNYIDALNKAIGVWNKVPKKDYKFRPVKKVRQTLNGHIAFAKEAQQIYRDRKAAIAAGKNSKTNSKTKTSSNKNTKPAGSKSFKVGDKISAFYKRFPHSDWMYGVIKKIENGLYVVDVAGPKKYSGTQKLSAKMLYKYWDYVQFLDEVRSNKELKYISNAINDICKQCKPKGRGVPLDGRDIVKVVASIDKLAAIIKKYPPIPDDLNLEDDYRISPKPYMMLVEKKQEFINLKNKQLIDKHIAELYKGTFSPKSVKNFKQLKYPNGKIIFWDHMLCKDPTAAKIKQAVTADLAAYIKEVGMTQSPESFLKGWNDMVKKKKAKILAQANKPQNFSKEHPYQDARKAALYKRDLGGSPIKVMFDATKSTIYGGSNKNKRIRGVAIFKEPGCPYYKYVEFAVFEKYLGVGRYAAPRCLYSSSGYTKSY